MKLSPRKAIVSMVSLAACLFTHFAFANQTFASVNLDLDSIITESDALGDSMLVKDLQPFLLYPTATVKAFGGKYYGVDMQALWPFFANSQLDNLFGIFEGDVALKSNNGWYAGAGIGYRRVIANSYVSGAYLLGNYNSTGTSRSFWLLNPGIEVLGYSWDFRTNGYVSLGAKHWYGNATWADDLGIYDYEHFSGHEQYNVKFRAYEEVGYGVDAELGLQIPYLTNPKIYVGGYYFTRGKQLGDVSGVEGRLVYPVGSHFSLEGRASYDNEKRTTLLLGVRVNLGGFSREQKANFGVAGRLEDPIEHFFASFDNASIVPVSQSYNTDGIELLERDHIIFVKPEADGGLGGGSGTYENPYSGFDQSRMDNIELDQDYQQYVNIYFAPGGYDLGAGFNRTLMLPANVAMYGRQNDYLAPATGDNRATFFSELYFGPASKNVSVDSIILYNMLGDPSRIGINIDGSTNINFNNVKVGTDDEVDGYQYKTTVQLNNATDINFTNSSIYSYAGDGVGISLLTGSVANLNGGNYISAGYNEAVAFGVQIDSTSILNLNGVAGNKNSILARATDLGFDPVGIHNSGTINMNSYNIVKSSSQYTGAAGIINTNIGTVNIFGDYNVISGSVGDSALNSSGRNQNVHGVTNLADLLGTPLAPQVVGIYSDGGAVNLAGHNNEISAYGLSADSSMALGGLYIANSTIFMVSGSNNKILASTNNGLFAYGMFANYSTVNVTGADNQVLAHTINGVIGAGIEGYGSSAIAITGNGNSILADGVATDYLTGVDLQLGSRLYVGSAANPSATTGNVIAGGATTGGGISDSGVSGIRISGSGSQADIIGAQNKVTATATGGNGNAMGVAVYDYGVLRVNGSGNEIAATTVAGSSRGADGINAGPNANVYISGASNKITGTAISGYANGINLEGIMGGSATLDLTGSSNTIIGISQSAGAAGSGIKAINYSAVTIDDTAANNLIMGTNTSLTSATMNNNALGIPLKSGLGNGITIDNGSTLFVLGVGNTIAGNSSLDANGIWSSNSTLNVTGGTKINATSSGGGIASGVYASDSKLSVIGSNLTVDSLYGKVHGLNIGGAGSVVNLQSVALNLGHLKTATVLSSPTEVIGGYLHDNASASTFFAENTHFNVVGESPTVMWGIASAAGVDATSALRLQGGGNFFSINLYDPSQSPAVDKRVNTAAY